MIKSFQWFYETFADPVFWKFSHLKNNSIPSNSLKYSEVRIGVFLTMDSVRIRASLISDKVGLLVSMNEIYLTNTSLPTSLKLRDLI